MSKTHRSQTFRVFVSSTFADFEPERNALQDRVFPNLRAHCEARGFRFEPIDLRWGVNEEAGLDQQTMRICLGELENCQRISPRPNFIILAGDRYGWRPLPFKIEADEFEQLMAHLTPEDQVRLRFDETRPEIRQGEGNGWYRRDDNAVPPAYVLLPREPDSEFADPERWAQEEVRLHELLRSAAAKQFPDPTAPERAKYFHSATHQEIQAGLFSHPDAKDHVFAYLREKSETRNPKSEHSSGDEEASRALKAQLADRLPKDHVHRFPAPIRLTGLFKKKNAEGKEAARLQQFCDRVEADLKQIIDNEIASHESRSEQEAENELHRAFAEERASHFVGRKEPLSEPIR